MRSRKQFSIPTLGRDGSNVIFLMVTNIEDRGSACGSRGSACGSRQFWNVFFLMVTNNENRGSAVAPEEVLAAPDKFGIEEIYPTASNGSVW